MTTKNQPARPQKAAKAPGAAADARPQKAAKAAGAAASARPQKTTGAAAVAARLEPPATILTAVKLMYAGAILTAIGIAANVVAVATGGAALRAAAIAAHKHPTIAQVHSTQSVLITGAIFSGLVEVALWIFVARANRGGLGWARIIATALFALSTWILIRQFLGQLALVGVIYTSLSWLIGAGATYYLWRKESSTYFAA